jgi:hypothetical protein
MKLDKKFNDFIANHPIAMAFVIEAMHYYSKEVIGSQEKLRKDMKHHIIHPDLWIKLANDWRNSYETR